MEDSIRYPCGNSEVKEADSLVGSLNKGQRQLSDFHYAQPTAHRTGPYETLSR